MQEAYERAHTRISIHPSRAGRDVAPWIVAIVWPISIHPPRAGRDGAAGPVLIYQFHFNPPSPCREGQGPGPQALRGKTISIHPPRAGRDTTPEQSKICTGISIHPPRAGRDNRACRSGLVIRISIHPPRAGRDCRVSCRQTQTPDFNPPSPCGEGP